MEVLIETTVAALHSLRDVVLDWGRPSSKKHRLSSEAGSGDVLYDSDFHLFKKDHSAAISRSMVFEPFSTTTL